MDTLLAVSGWILALFVFLAVVPTTVVTLARLLAKADVSATESEERPTVSVIVAAKNEEANIETAICSLLKSDYPAMTITAVNDRSTDRTGEILESLRQRDDRLTVVHINQLPADWLGKNYAMHVAASRSDGEYLLFTDGDVEFDPAAIRSAMQHVHHNKIDHLCLLPTMKPGSFFENSLVTFFSLCFCVGLQSWLVPTSFKFAYVGVGAFNLVRRKAYDQIGGHEPLKFDVLDDVKLGKLLKQHGAKQDLRRTEGLVSVRWQPSAWGVITGLEKNGFAALNYSKLQLLMTTVVYLLGFIAPYVVIACCPDFRCWGFLAAVVTWHLMYGYIGVRLGTGWATFFVFPFASLGLAFAFWRSAWITLRQGGVRWRDTFYSLESLRERLAG